MNQRTPPTPSRSDKAIRPMATKANPTFTSDERIEAIENMRKRVNVYVDYMIAAGNLTCSSAEAKETALAAFHDHMAGMERRLARIYEELRLG